MLPILYTNWANYREIIIVKKSAVLVTEEINLFTFTPNFLVL